MKFRISKSQAKAFKARWNAVNAMERQELQTVTLGQKLRQLAALMASFKSLGWEEQLSLGEEEVRKRWIQLRRVEGG